MIVYGLKTGQTVAKLLLSFSGAYLLSITVLHLIPEVFGSGKPNIGYYILLGLLIQLILDFFSKGAEHGHLHVQKDMLFPTALFISLSLHAFIEGIPLGGGHGHDQLLWAIVIHKVPIAILLGTFFVNSRFPKLKASIFLIFFALMSPLGAYTGSTSSFLVDYSTEITAIVIGIFLHISTIILFESSKEHNFNLLKFIAIVVGMLIAVLV
jgi:zinc transporter ZupT